MFLAIIVCISTLSLVSAVTIDFKDQYQPGETLIVSISGNFVDPLAKESISFYSGRIQIPLIYDIAKINSKYYLYALLQNQVRNYTLKIKNARFIENNEEHKEDLEFNFSVSGNITDFSIDPGFIITQKEFIIKLQSKSKPLIVAANIPESQNASKAFSIPAGETKLAKFTPEEFSSDFSFLEFSTANTKYEIPIKLLVSKNNSLGNFSGMEFNRKIMNITGLKNNQTTFILLLKNTGNTTLYNITFSLQQNIQIEPQTIEALYPQDAQQVNITLSLGEKEILTTITAADSSSTAFAQVQVLAEVTENQSELFVPPAPALESCSNLGGNLCKITEDCKGDFINAQEGKCCKGTCFVPQPESNTARYIVIGVIALLIFLLIYFTYRKSKTKKKQFTDLMTKKNKEFDEKMHPETEVTGKLSKS